MKIKVGDIVTLSAKAGIVSSQTLIVAQKLPFDEVLLVEADLATEIIKGPLQTAKTKERFIKTVRTPAYQYNAPKPGTVFMREYNGHARSTLTVGYNASETMALIYCPHGLVQEARWIPVHEHAVLCDLVPKAEAKPEETPVPPTDSIRHTVLDEARRLIYGERQNDYGSVSENFADIAKGWSVLFKTEVTPEQVGLAMAWLKICRANKGNCAKMDSLIDLAGYAGCIEKIKNGE